MANLFPGNYFTPCCTYKLAPARLVQIAMMSVAKHMNLHATAIMAVFCLICLPTTGSALEIESGQFSEQLVFVPNLGQWDQKVQFRADAEGAVVWLTDNGVYYHFVRTTGAAVQQEPPDRLSQLPAAAEAVLIKASMVGSRPAAKGSGESPVATRYNYFLGGDPARWQSNLPAYREVVYTDVYPGIDLRFSSRQGRLKYEFVVAPNANPELIQMSYPDAGLLEVQGDRLTVSKSEFSFSDTGLWAFQGTEGINDVACSFDLLENNVIGFNIGSYDETQVLTIDPILVYSTFLGGSLNDYGYDIAVENSYFYVIGDTFSSSFPTFNGFNSTYSGSRDVFVTKFAEDGQTLIYSTFLGGTGGDYANGLAVENGFAYVAGITDSTDFPTYNGFNLTSNGGDECFVSKLATDGQSLIYSSYLGGTSHEYRCCIAVESGFAYVTGWTQSSTTFPTTVGAYQSTSNGGMDCFVTKINTNGNGLEYSTYLGGSGDDYGRSIAVESGFAYVTGNTYSSSDFPVLNAYDSTYNVNSDGFVTKLATDGQALAFSTYIGGSGLDYSNDITLEGEFIFITGTTGSTDLPMVNSFDSTKNNNWDGFVAQFTNDGQNLVYSTYIGGTDIDRSHSIAVEGDYAYITGHTYSTDFPTDNGYDTTHNGFIDCFVAKLDVRCGKLEYGTYLGGDGGSYTEEGYGIAVESGTAYITGNTNSALFPTVDAFNSTHGGGFDCFVSILSDDSDLDSLSDWHEGLYGTNPLSIDSDLDGHSDAYEIAEGTDPLNPYSYPGVTSNSEYIMAYSSFLSGSAQDKIESIRVEDGFIYLSGTTSSSNFPMINAWNSTFGGESDVFIVKMSEDGQSLIFSTFVGGSNYDASNAIDVYDGCVFCTGSTSSSNFPTYLAQDPSHNGFDDGFLFKLASDGSALEFSTFLGGTGTDSLRDVCVEDGHAYVTGSTSSTDFPTVNAYDSTSVSGDAVVAKYAIDGQSLVYSTILGGDLMSDWSKSISVDDGFAYVGGTAWSSDFPMENPLNDSIANSEAFLTKLSQDGSSLVYSTFIGGAGYDYINALYVDRGFAYLTGVTSSDDFPLSNALYPTRIFGTLTGFVAKMNTDGLSFVYSTYLAGTGDVTPTDIVTDKGRVIVTGYTEDTEFPTTIGHTYTCDPSSIDSFVTKFSLDGQELLYSTCFGGTDTDYSRAVDTYDGLLYVAGYTQSDDFPSIVAYNDTRGGGDDGFVAVFDIDSDFDALPDFTEEIIGTNMFAVDSDMDNYLDSYEFYYGSDPLDSMSVPAMPQAWFDAIYVDLDGNATLIQQIISWMDGNHTAIETLFNYVEGNATLLLDTIAAVGENTDQLVVLAALISQNTDLLSTLNATHIGDIDQIMDILDMLGVTVGDTDYDGLNDLEEIALGTDIQCIDTDNDNLNDAYEVKIGTNPLDDDSDDDTYLDGAEVLAGTDPQDALSYPGSDTTTTSSTETTTSTTTSDTDDTGMIIVVGIAGGAGVIGIVVALSIIKKRRLSG